MLFSGCPSLHLCVAFLWKWYLSYSALELAQSSLNINSPDVCELLNMCLQQRIDSENCVRIMAIETRWDIVFSSVFFKALSVRDEQPPDSELFFFFFCTERDFDQRYSSTVPQAFSCPALRGNLVVELSLLGIFLWGSAQPLCESRDCRRSALNIRGDLEDSLSLCFCLLLFDKYN